LPARQVSRQWELPSFQSAVITTNGVLLTAHVGSSKEPPSVRRLPDVAQSAAPASSGGVSPPVRSRDETSRELAAETVALQIAGQFPTSENSTVTVFLGIPSPCTAIALSPDGAFTVTGHSDGTVAVFETGSGRLLHAAERAFQAGNKPLAVHALAFSAGGRTVAATTFDWVSMKIWQVPELHPIGSHWFGKKFELPIAVSPDGHQLAFGGSALDLGINLWDAALRQPVTQLHGHQDFLYAVAYSPDGRTLASGVRDGLLKLWHLPTQRQVGTVLALPEQTKFAQLTFSPDGAWLGASDTRGNLHLLHAPALAETDAKP
jgi:WD40 repeat protein